MISGCVAKDDANNVRQFELGIRTDLSGAELQNRVRTIIRTFNQLDERAAMLALMPGKSFV